MNSSWSLFIYVIFFLIKKGLFIYVLFEFKHKDFFLFSRMYLPNTVP